MLQYGCQVNQTKGIHHIDTIPFEQVYNNEIFTTMMLTKIHIN